MFPRSYETSQSPIGNHSTSLQTNREPPRWKNHLLSRIGEISEIARTDEDVMILDDFSIRPKTSTMGGTQPCLRRLIHINATVICACTTARYGYVDTLPHAR